MSYTVLCMSTFSKQTLHKHDWNEAGLGPEHCNLSFLGGGRGEECKVQITCPLHVTPGGQG